MNLTSLQGLVKEHSGLLLSGLSALLIAVRLYAMAGFNEVSAREILTVTGPGNVILGTLVGSLSTFAALTLLSLVTYTVSMEETLRPAPRDVARFLSTGPGLLTLGVGAGMVVIVPVRLAVVLVLMLVLVLTKEKRPGWGDSWTGRIFLMACFSFAVIMFVRAPPWMPSCALDVGSGPRTGYLLGTESDELVILWADTRLVHRYPADELKSQQLCSDFDAQAWHQRPLLESFSRSQESVYPPCP